MPEMIKLLESTQSNIAKDENGISSISFSIIKSSISSL